MAHAATTVPSSDDILTWAITRSQLEISIKAKGLTQASCYYCNNKSIELKMAWLECNWGQVKSIIEDDSLQKIIQEQQALIIKKRSLFFNKVHQELDDFKDDIVSKRHLELSKAERQALIQNIKSARELIIQKELLESFGGIKQHLHPADALNTRAKSPDNTRRIRAYSAGDKIPITAGTWLSAGITGAPKDRALPIPAQAREAKAAAPISQTQKPSECCVLSCFKATWQAFLALDDTGPDTEESLLRRYPRGYGT